MSWSTGSASSSRTARPSETGWGSWTTARWSSKATGSPGLVRPRRRPRPTAASMPAAARSSRRSWTRILTLHSPATAPTNSPPAWPGPATTAAASRGPFPRPARHQTMSSGHCSPPGSRRCAPRAPAPSRSRAATGSPSSTRPGCCASPAKSPTRQRSSERTSAPTALTPRTTSTWSPGRCSRPARRTPGGSTSSASPRARTRSTATRHAPCWPRDVPPDSACGSTVTSSATAQASPSPPNSGRRASTTAPTCPPPTSTRWPAARRSRRSCLESSSPPGRPTRTRAHWSTPASG